MNTPTAAVLPEPTPAPGDTRITATHSEFFAVDGLHAHAFASDNEAPVHRRLCLTLSTLSGLQVTLQITPDAATALAEALNNAADWMMQAPARKVLAAEQEARDQIAGGERAPMHSGERGELDAAALRTVREGAMA